MLSLECIVLSVKHHADIASLRQNMQTVAEAIDALDITAADLPAHLAALEKVNGLSIDLYSEKGETLYHGKEQIFAGGGKVTMKDRREFADGSYFETQVLERQNAQYIVYVRPMSFGGTVEMFSRKSTIDDNANAAIAVTTGTGIAALTLALVLRANSRASSTSMWEW